MGGNLLNLCRLNYQSGKERDSQLLSLKACYYNKPIYDCWLSTPLGPLCFDTGAAFNSCIKFGSHCSL